jgi:hypothetical protein
MRKNSILLCALLSSATAFSQEVISSTGDTYSNANGIISFTIGEVIINTGTDGTNILTQGFHQTNWTFVGLEDFSPNYEVSVFPNPSTNVLTIKTSEFEGVSYNLYDALGQIVIQNKLSGAETMVEVKDLPTGSYSLTLVSNNENLKTFKLIKN